MLSPSAALLLIPAEASATEGLQPEGAPAQVSRTKIFFSAPGTSDTPSTDAKTTTAYRLSALIVGAGSEIAPALAVERVAVEATRGMTRTAGGGLNTVNVSAFEVPPPPPSVGVETVTGTVAAAATSPAAIAAFTPVGLVKVVVRALPFHSTVEHGTRLPAVALVASTPRRNAAEPAWALDGKSVPMTGVGSGVGDGTIVNGEEADAKDGSVALDTVIEGVPGNAVSTAEMTAVSCVALTKVVGRGEPFQFTTSPFGTKFVPFTVKVMTSALQAGVVLFDVVDPESEVIVGSTIGKAMALDVLAPAAGLATESCTVSTVVRLAAVTDTLSCVGLT
jgi:hypothetical protein